MDVPYLSEEELRRRAGEFLSKHNPKGEIPVPIERTVEFDLKLDIVPVPGLIKVRGVNGFLTSDRSSIYVDHSLLEQGTSRYFFTLAHELAHSVLHAKLYRGFKSEQDWIEFHGAMAAHSIASAEWQADTFAGFVLVPPADLRRELAASFPQLSCAVLDADPKFDLSGEAFWHYVADKLAKKFCVSRDTTRIRLEKDKEFFRNREKGAVEDCCRMIPH